MPDISAPDFKIFEIPYIHPKLDLADLKENNKLYTDDEIKSIEASCFEEGARIKAEKLKIDRAKWDIIKVPKGTIYAIYKGKEAGHIGKGTYGFTKLGQNLKTGTLAVLKIIADKEDEFKDAVKNEKKGLKAANQLIFFQTREVSRKNKKQHEILMEFASGTPLTKLILSNRNMPTVSWLDLCLAVVDSVDVLHKKDRLHNDLSAGNFIFDRSTLKAMLIDYGLCKGLKKADGDKEIYDSLMKWGDQNPSYMAPECSSGKYSKKSDVYSVGVLLALMLNLAKIPEKKTDRLNLLPLHFSYDADFPCKIEPLSVRKEIREYIKQMLGNDPACRPTISEVGEFLRAVKSRYLHLPGLLTRVSYLDLTNYTSLSDSDRQYKVMISKLSKKDRVYLVDAQEKNQKNYLKIRKELEAHGVIVMPQVLQSQSNVTSAVYAHMEANANLEDARICECTLMQYAAETSLTAISELRKKIIIGLKHEVSRLSNKYQNSLSPEHRMRRIHLAICALTTAESYEDFQKILTQLQNDLLSKNPIMRFFQSYCGIKTTNTFKEVRVLVNKLENDKSKLKSQPPTPRPPPRRL